MSRPYRCNNCGCVFDEPFVIRTTYEAYNGVAGFFSDSTPFSYEACPNCRDEDFDEIEDEEDDEE